MRAERAWVQADSFITGKEEGGLEPGPGARPVAKAQREQDDVEKRVLGNGDNGP